MLQTVVTVLFFVAALSLMVAAMLAPCTIAWLTVSRSWPQLFPWPVWRPVLLCFVLALGYSGWQHAFADIWLLARCLFIGSGVATLLLIPAAAGWRGWQLWRQR